MKTVLVTGGAGFIGGTFVRQMLARPEWQVVNLDALTYAGCLASLASVRDDPRHTFVHGDVRDAQLVAQLLNEHQCDAIVHFAAESHVDRSIASPAEFADTNVMGTLQLLRAAFGYWERAKPSLKRDFRLVHISTDEVYGALKLEEPPFHEASPYRPNSPYSASKAASDHFVRAFHKTYGLPTIITHCSNNYGPFQHPEKLIPLMILNALSGKALPVYGSGTNVRDWIHVDDHCEALRLVLQQGVPGECYDIGGHCERSNIDVVHLICKQVDRILGHTAAHSCCSLIRFVDDRRGHDLRYAIDVSKITTELGWRPQLVLEDCLADVVDWYRQHPDWVAAASHHHERAKR